VQAQGGPRAVEQGAAAVSYPSWTAHQVAPQRPRAGTASTRPPLTYPSPGRGEHRPRSASARHLCPELPRPRAGPTRGQLDHLGQPGPLGHLGPAVVEVDPGRAPSTPCPGGHRHNGAGSRDAVECLSGPAPAGLRPAPQGDHPACRPDTGRPRAVEQGPGRRELPKLDGTTTHGSLPPASAAPVPVPRQRTAPPCRWSSAPPYDHREYRAATHLPRPRAGPARGQLDHLGQPGHLDHTPRAARPPRPRAARPPRAPRAPRPARPGGRAGPAPELVRPDTRHQVAEPDTRTVPGRALVERSSGPHLTPCRPSSPRTGPRQTTSGHLGQPGPLVPRPPRPRAARPPRPRPGPLGTLGPPRPGHLDSLDHDRLGHDSSGTSATTARAPRPRAPRATSGSQAPRSARPHLGPARPQGGSLWPSCEPRNALTCGLTTTSHARGADNDVEA